MVAQICINDLVVYDAGPSWDRDPGPKERQGHHCVEVVSIDGDILTVRNIFGQKHKMHQNDVLEIQTDRTTWDTMWPFTPKFEN